MSNKVPQIRFNGYSDEWEERKLSDISDVTKLAGFEFTKYVRYQETGKIIALRGLNVKNGKLVLDDVKYIDDSDFSKLNRSKLYKNDILLTYVGTVGELAIVPEDDKYYLAPNVARIRLQDHVNSIFICQMMNDSNFYNRIILPLIATSSQPALSMKNVRKFQLLMPDYQEQQKIGSFFKQLDQTITLHQRKLAKLKELKQGYLQKMFPQNGSKFPQLRFAGFADDWEERKLGELGKIYTGNTPKTSDLDNWTDNKEGHIWITPTDIDKLIMSDSDRHLSEQGWSKARKIPENSVLITSIASIGKNTINAVPVAFNQQINAIVPEKNDSYFILSAMIKDTARFASVAGQTATAIINKTTFEKFQIATPSYKEQQKIGTFFKQLDDTITLHQRKLDLLKEQKKGFLQKMFV